MLQRNRKSEEVSTNITHNTVSDPVEEQRGQGAIRLNTAKEAVSVCTMYMFYSSRSDQ